METVGLRPAIFPGCCFGCFSYSLPVNCEDESLPASRPLFVTELPSSFQFKQSFAASSNVPQKPQEAPTALSRPLFVAESGPLVSFSNPRHSPPEQQKQTKRFVQQTAVPSMLECRLPQSYAPNFSKIFNKTEQINKASAFHFRR